MLRFRDPVTGEELRTLEEEAAALRESEAQVAELRALVRDLRGGKNAPGDTSR